MSDLISRQDTIDRINEYIEEYSEIDSDGNHSEKWCAMQEAKMTIENMPSAQPEPCEDAVSRQRLLSDLKELTAAWGKYPVMEEQIKGVETAIGYVETIPSAQPDDRLAKIADILEGTIDHFDLEDAMDVLYQIKDVLR